MRGAHGVQGLVVVASSSSSAAVGKRRRRRCQRRGIFVESRTKECVQVRRVMMLELSVTDVARTLREKDGDCRLQIN
jgi:hypothetical protein